jgi:tripartite ATP-independent transporter DctP family solute receptor
MSAGHGFTKVGIVMHSHYMRKTLPLLLLSALAVLWGCFVISRSVQAAETSSPLVLKVAHIYGPDSPWHDAAKAFATAVERESNGAVRLEIAAGTMDWPASIEGLRTGLTDIVLQSIGTLDRYHVIAGIESYPYLLRDVEHFKTVYYGAVGRALFNEIANRTGFRVIGAGYRGARHLSANRRIETPSDLKGLKVRVPPLTMYRKTWDMLGATTMPLGIAELRLALQQGVVDGQENPLETIDDARVHEVQKYIMETGHILGAMTFIFSDTRFRNLPTATQKLLEREGERAMLDVTSRIQAIEAEYKRKMSEQGVTFVAVDRAAFRERLVPLQREFPDLAEWVQRIQALP